MIVDRRTGRKAATLRLSTLNYPLSTKTGCQGWTRTNTARLNRPPCYFDTTWQFEIGAAGKTRTCIGSFRRRMPLYLGHGSGRKGLMEWWICALMGNTDRAARESNNPVIQHPSRKMVSAAGLAPAIPRSQAECVGCYATRWKMADPKGFAPSAFPQTTGCSAN